MVGIVAQTLKHGSMVDLMLCILPQFFKKVKNTLEQPQKTRVLREATGVQRENPKGTVQGAKWNDLWEPQGAGSRRVTKGRSPPLWTSAFPLLVRNNQQAFFTRLLSRALQWDKGELPQGWSPGLGDPSPRDRRLRTWSLQRPPEQPPAPGGHSPCQEAWLAPDGTGVGGKPLPGRKQVVSEVATEIVLKGKPQPGPATAADPTGFYFSIQAFLSCSRKDLQ